MDDYDGVLDALQKHRDKLWEMTQRNMTSDYVGLNVMDDIRFYQIEQIDEAIMARKNKTPQREWVGLTDEELHALHFELKVQTMGGINTLGMYRILEAKLKEKNT